MTTIESVPDNAIAQEIEVTIVDTDVHPLPVSGEVLKSYAPAEWKDKLWPTGNAVSPVPHFYDTPDSYKTNSLRVDASPPRGGVATPRGGHHGPRHPARALGQEHGHRLRPNARRAIARRAGR